MRVSRSGYIASSMGGMLLGLIPADLLALLAGRLWPEMMPFVFLTFFLAWVAFGIGNILRDTGKRVIAPMTNAQATVEINRDVGGHGYVATVVAVLLMEVSVAPIIAGSIGLLWPAGRWAVFFVCFVGSVLMTILYVKESLRRHHEGQ